MDKARELLMLGFGEILLESPSLASAAAAGSPMREDSAHIVRGVAPGSASPRAGEGAPWGGGHGIGLEAYFYFSCQLFIELIRCLPAACLGAMPCNMCWSMCVYMSGHGSGGLAWLGYGCSYVCRLWLRQYACVRTCLSGLVPSLV